jgi:hypothetical protein
MQNAIAAVKQWWPHWAFSLRWLFLWIVALSFWQITARAMPAPLDSGSELNQEQPFAMARLTDDALQDPDGAIAKRQIRKNYEADCGNRLSSFAEQLSDIKRQGEKFGIGQQAVFATALQRAEEKKSELRTILGAFMRMDADLWESQVNDLEGAFQDLDLAVSQAQHLLYVTDGSQELYAH